MKGCIRTRVKTRPISGLGVSLRAFTPLGWCFTKLAPGIWTSEWGNLASRDVLPGATGLARRESVAQP